MEMMEKRKGAALKPIIPMRNRRIIKPQVIRKDRKQDMLSEIERLAAKVEPQFAEAIMAYLTGLQDAVSLEAIAEALKAGDVAKVISLIAGADVGAAGAAIEDAVHAAVWGGGAIAASGINGTLSGVHFAFDKLNPRLIDWLKSYQLDLIRRIGTETKEAIRDQLVAGMYAGQNPVDVARKIKGAIGLTPRQAKAVENFRKELETFHLKRSAAGWNLGGKIDRVHGTQVIRPDEDGTPKDGIDARRLRDFRFDSQLSQAMNARKPLTPAQIDKMVAAYERKYLRYRSQTIARTEALRTTNFGVQDAWRQAISTGKATESLVRRQWIVAKDERLCEVCSAIPKMNGKRGVPFGQPFATPKGPVMMPPLHPGCRCSLYLKQYEPEQLTE